MEIRSAIQEDRSVQVPEPPSLLFDVSCTALGISTHAQDTNSTSFVCRCAY